MCGICGELRFDGSSPDPAVIKRMSEKIARRGPDHEAVISDGPLAFGHRRLAIIDLTPSADQPMTDTDLRISLVFNGTIYNYKELRSELIEMGYSFFSEGDTEVIIKAYHAWGEKCVERFFGMFAFALWDMRHATLFMARDRFGIKPLYYSLDGAHLRFASNVQALLAAGGVDTSIDAIALHHHFTLHAVVPAPRTILNGVKKLPPATTMTLTPAGKITQRTYWSLDATRPEQTLSEQDWLKATRIVLTRAVERHRLASDVPVGVLLSGGLDSSLLVALLADHVEHLLTFSVGFEDIGDGAEKGDEFEYSDQVAEHFKTRHHKFLIPNSEVLNRLPEAVSNMAEPMVSQDTVAFYLLGERVSDEVKVVLSGQGADEVFGGYFWYPVMDQSTGSNLEKFRSNYFDRDHNEYLEMVSPAYHVPDVTSVMVESALNRDKADTFLDQVLRFDATTLVVDDPVKRVDNMTMAWGLEARVPFLDHELVELAARMNLSSKKAANFL
jgi:asparagine synthase (glutamine-hydrolysing)